MHLVFVYGTLKRGEPNHGVLTSPANGFAQYFGTAQTVNHYPLVIASRFNIPYLLKRTGMGHQVHGEVYRVDDVMLAALDNLESHPTYYQREEIEVRWLENKLRQSTHVASCWVYFLTVYKPFMLELPFLENYTSNGDHNLPYIPRYKRPEGHNPQNEVK